MATKFTCSLCRKRFATEKGCKAHIRDFHKKRTDGEALTVSRHIADDSEMSEAEYLIERHWGL